MAICSSGSRAVPWVVGGPFGVPWFVLPGLELIKTQDRNMNRSTNNQEASWKITHRSQRIEDTRLDSRAVYVRYSKRKGWSRPPCGLEFGQSKHLSNPTSFVGNLTLWYVEEAKGKPVILRGSPTLDMPNRPCKRDQPEQTSLCRC